MLSIFSMKNKENLKTFMTQESTAYLIKLLWNGKFVSVKERRVFSYDRYSN